jgi:hypothetical protein
MLIYIHTAGRPRRQITFDYLPRALQSKVQIVVQHKERDAYRAALPAHAKLLILPSDIKTLSPTRQWLLDNCPEEKFCFLDDDLEFAVRRADNPTLFKACALLPEHFPRIFDWLEQELDFYAHAGIIAREGANRFTDGMPLECTRMMRVLAYHARAVRSVGARFDRLPSKQDFDMTLQLLRAGFPNRVSTMYTQGQRGSDATGGCSVYRTDAMMEESALGLQKLHPQFVKLVRKKTKSAWGGKERVDVTIQWKNAYESSRK